MIKRISFPKNNIFILYYFMLRFKLYYYELVQNYY